MWETSTCPRATQDVECESVRGTHRVGRAAPLALPCRDKLAIPRQTGSLLSQLPTIGFCRTEIPRPGDLARPLKIRRVTRRRMAPYFLCRIRSAAQISRCSGRPRHLEHAFFPLRMVITSGGGPTFSPSPITARAARAPGRAPGLVYTFATSSPAAPGRHA
jgi:hypothetical protein